MGVGGQRHALAALPPGRTPHLLYKRLVGPRAGLDGGGKSLPTGIPSPDLPARSESLYRLSYAGLPQTRLATINPLTPNYHYMGRTAQLTSRSCILYIYSTNIRTEYFKHAA